jgi:hypothetical protein
MKTPSYYKGSDGLTAVRVVESFELPHHEACATEYILRAGFKVPGDKLVDLRKAVWWIRRAIKREEAKRARERTDLDMTNA